MKVARFQSLSDLAGSSGAAAAMKDGDMEEVDEGVAALEIDDSGNQGKKKKRVKRRVKKAKNSAKKTAMLIEESRSQPMSRRGSTFDEGGSGRRDSLSVVEPGYLGGLDRRRSSVVPEDLPKRDSLPRRPSQTELGTKRFLYLIVTLYIHISLTDAAKLAKICQLLQKPNRKEQKSFTWDEVVAEPQKEENIEK